MDALTSLASGLNLRAKLAYVGGACGKWLMDHNSAQSIWFHLIGKGEGWVHSPAWAQAQPMKVGDLVVFLPHAVRHLLSYSEADLPADTSDMRVADWDQGETSFVCGEIELGMPRSLLWQALPPEILIRRADAGPTLAQLIQLIIGESAGRGYGHESVVERLCDSLFILVARHCIDSGLVQRGIFAAMQDRRLATVLALIHGEPEKPWTVAELCRRAGVSKSVLSERFASLLGASPIDYLTGWRMQIAARWLKESGQTVERVAERCGYDSVPAFSKAFKRYCGVAPGAFRRGLPGLR